MASVRTRLNEISVGTLDGKRTVRVALPLGIAAHQRIVRIQDHGRGMGALSRIGQAYSATDG